MSAIPEAGGLLQNLIVGIGGAAAAYFAARKQFSSDETEKAEGGAHVGMISRLQQERDSHEKRADAAEEEARRERESRTSDREKIARLEARIESLTERNGRLTVSVRRFAQGLPKEVQRLVVTDFAELDERPSPLPMSPMPAIPKGPP